MSLIDDVRIAIFGNPPSEGYQPSRTAFLAALSEIVRSIDIVTTGVVGQNAQAVYATLATLSGHVEFPDQTLGLVYNDPTTDNNGLYIKNGATGGGSWAPTGLLGTGAQGPIGITGPDGKSLYQLAIDSGYISAGTPVSAFIAKIGGDIAAQAAITATNASNSANAGALTATQKASDAGAYLNAIKQIVGQGPLNAALTVQASTRAIMAAISNPALDTQVMLHEGGRFGLFAFDTGDKSASVASDPLQGIYVPPASDTTGKSGAWVRVDTRFPFIEWFGGGMGGDDTAAFAAIGDYITAQGGGVASGIPGKTYNVGHQDLTNDGYYMYKPRRLFEANNCALPVVLNFSGCRIRFNAGLRYGTFNSDGTPAGFNAQGKVSAPCLNAIFAITNCSGGFIVLPGMELDGNIAAMTIGGGFGDTGYQIGGDGIYFSEISGPIRVSSVHIHHMPRDGMEGSTPCANEGSPATNVLFEGMRLNNNCRNNFSLLGGRGWSFRDSSFIEAATNTPIGSAPGSGIDIEAEQALIRDIHFENCLFSNNQNNGMVADSGDTKGVQFDRCRFIAPQGTAAWPNKPDMVFSDCLLVGTVYPLYSGNPSAVKFKRCKFTDDPTLSPTGTMVTSGYYLIDGGGGNDQVLFDECVINVTNSKNMACYLNGNLGSGGTAGAIWRNSKVTAVSGAAASIFGPRLEGVNTWNGAVSLEGILWTGTLVLNGVDLTFFTQTWDPPQIQPGQSATTNIGILGKPGSFGWKTDVTFDQDLLGGVLSGYVNTGLPAIVVTLINPTTAPIDIAAGTLKVRIKPMT